MKKHLLTILLALLVLAGSLGFSTQTVLAYSDDELKTADALYSLGLFLGGSDSYMLDKQMDRTEAVTVIVRMMGKEKEALEGTYTHPFTDEIPKWGEKYVAYAYANGIIKGTSPTTFSANMTMNQQMFCTICLRVLGYDDSLAKPDFTWASCIVAAQNEGISPPTKIEGFDRGNAVDFMWSTMNTHIKGSKKLCAEKLAASGVFSLETFEHAKEIQKLGRTKEDGTGELSLIDVYREVENKEDKTQGGTTGGGGSSTGGGGYSGGGSTGGGGSSSCGGGSSSGGGSTSGGSSTGGGGTTGGGSTTEGGGTTTGGGTTEGGTTGGGDTPTTPTEPDDPTPSDPTPENPTPEEPTKPEEKTDFTLPRLKF